MSEGLFTVAFDVAGETQIARSFDLADDMARDLSEPLGELMDRILASVEHQFETEGAAAHGERWAPLSEEYALWKAEHYPGRPILVATGEMKAQMLDRDTAVHVDAERAVYEPVSRIAGYHQTGADWLGNAWQHPGPYAHHLPARRMVDLSEDFKHEAVDRVFARWIARKLADAHDAAGGSDVIAA